MFKPLIAALAFFAIFGTMPATAYQTHSEQTQLGFKVLIKQSGFKCLWPHRYAKHLATVGRWIVVCNQKQGDDTTYFVDLHDDGHFTVTPAFPGK